MTRTTLPLIELSSGQIEERIHEVAMLNRLCASLAEVGAKLTPVVEGPVAEEAAGPTR